MSNWINDKPYRKQVCQRCLDAFFGSDARLCCWNCANGWERRDAIAATEETKPQAVEDKPKFVFTDAQRLNFLLRFFKIEGQGGIIRDAIDRAIIAHDKLDEWVAYDMEVDVGDPHAFDSYRFRGSPEQFKEHIERYENHGIPYKTVKVYE